MAVRAQTQPIIIRRQEADADHGHHGGAWKVAYADFMTAMMAFFLLMWIVSSASKAQLDGLAQYFTPATVSMTAKGGIGALGGTSMGPQGVMNQSNGVSKPTGMDHGKPSKVTPKAQPTPQATGKDSTAAATAQAAEPAIALDKAKAADAAKADGAKAGAHGAAVKTVTVIKTLDPHASDDAHFKAVQQEVTQAMMSAPDLKPLLKNVMFKKTPEGLRIQIVDQDHKAMFASGSAKVQGTTLVLMQRLGKAIAGLPNKILISGHTDSVPYAEGARRDNWELSSERANATRRVFLSAGVAPGRVTRISGLADTSPMIPANPRDPRNRRISVLLAYQKSDLPAAAPTVTATGAAPVVPATSAPATAATPAPSAPPATQEEATLHQATPAAQPATGPLARTYAAVTLADLRKGNP